MGHLINNGGSLIAPRTVTFSKENKGTRIWFSADDSAKDSKVTEIIKLTGDKTTEYDVYDKSVTLGKLSGMSNHQIMQLAKEQNKKSFTHIVKDWVVSDLPNTRYSYFDEYNGKKGVYTLRVGNGDNGGCNFNANGKVINKYTYRPSDYTDDDSDDLPFSSNSDPNSTIIMKAFQDALSSTKYQGPRTAKLYTELTTDSSGNHVTSQFLSIPCTYYDGASDVCQKNFFNMCKKDPSVVKNVISYEKASSSHNDGESDVDAEYKAFNKYIKPMLASKSFQQQYTKDAFIPRDTWDKYNLNIATPFKIYKTRFIGYIWTYNKAHGVLVTKAQNDHQKAAFPKPPAHN